MAARLRQPRTDDGDPSLKSPAAFVDLLDDDTRSCDLEWNREIALPNCLADAQDSDRADNERRMHEALLPASLPEDGCVRLEGPSSNRFPLRQRGSSHHQHHGNPPQHRRPPNRLLDRDAAFLQSRGRWRVQHLSESAAKLFPTSSRQYHDAYNNEPNDEELEIGNDSEDEDRVVVPHIGRTLRSRPFRDFWGSWFYTLAYQQTGVLMIILFVGYFTLVLLFATLYWTTSRLGSSSPSHPRSNAYHDVDDPSGSHSTTTTNNARHYARLFCDMDLHKPMEALFFSLSTMASIGYGVSDYYFGECWMPFLLVMIQVCCAITFDAVAIGLLFQRISRGHKRSKSVLLSSTAAIHRVRGVPYLHIRIAELRRHALLEATVRAYCIRHERHWVRRVAHRHVRSSSDVDIDANFGEPSHTVETTHFVTKPMKLQHEDSNGGGPSLQLLMSLPQVIVHPMDEQSPLRPPPWWYDCHAERHTYSTPPADTLTATEDDLIIDASHSDKESGRQQQLRFEQDTNDLTRFLLDRETEVVVLVEGIDELTGISAQTRHSYTAAHDFSWNQSFVPCVMPYHSVPPDERQEQAGTRFSWLHGHSRRRRRSNVPVCVVDFSKFHETRTSSFDSASSPYVL